MEIDGAAIALGDTLRVFDTDGIQCGSVTIRSEGQYGFLHVYGDDPDTKSIDEGAKSGQPITLVWQGYEVARLVTAKLRWTGERTPVRHDVQYFTPTDVGDIPLPRTVSLSPAKPNPANPSTVIQFALPDAGPTQLVVYSLNGQRVRTLVDDMRPAGYHQVRWNGVDSRGRSVASGVYVYRLITPTATRTQRLVFLR